MTARVCRPKSPGEHCSVGPMQHSFFTMLIAKVSPAGYFCTDRDFESTWRIYGLIQLVLQKINKQIDTMTYNYPWLDVLKYDVARWSCSNHLYITIHFFAQMLSNNASLTNEIGWRTSLRGILVAFLLPHFRQQSTSQRRIFIRFHSIKKCLRSVLWDWQRIEASLQKKQKLKISRTTKMATESLRRIAFWRRASKAK